MAQRIEEGNMKREKLSRENEREIEKRVRQLKAIMAQPVPLSLEEAQLQCQSVNGIPGKKFWEEGPGFVSFGRRLPAN
jgi:hypothetical protein